MPRWPKPPPNSVSSVRTTEGDRRLPMPPAGTPDAPTVLTTAELCARWRCTARTLERMARDGRVRRLKLRGGVRYLVDEVQRIERGEPVPSPMVSAMTEVADRIASATTVLVAPPPAELTTAEPVPRAVRRVSIREPSAA